MQICGEHKESGILRHGFFASPFSQDAGSPEVETEVKGRNKGGYHACPIGMKNLFC